MMIVTAGGYLHNVVCTYQQKQEFICCPENFGRNVCTRVTADIQAKALGVDNLILYVENAVLNGDCIFVQRDDITFDIICELITARVDSQMLEIIAVYETDF